MLQAHFHSPSEHSIGGGYFAAEAHLVHKSAAGNLLVLGIFMQEAVKSFTPNNNTFLNVFWDAAGANTIAGITTDIEDFETPLNPYDTFLPGRQTHYVYSGSLTTPPCTEGVQWLVFDQPVMISPDDIYIIRKAISTLPHTIVSASGNNNRYPVQSLNGRDVKLFLGDGVCDTSATDEDDDNDGNNDSRHNATAALAIAIAALIVAVVSLGALIFVVFELRSKGEQMPVPTQEVVSNEPKQSPSVEMTTVAQDTA